MTINELQDEIIEDFAIFDDWFDKYSRIIELGNELPAFPDEKKLPENLIEGCQSKVWIDATLNEDGSIKELHCTYDPKTKNGTGFNERKPNGTIHFVDASTALPATFNLFEPLILDSVVSSENFKSSGVTLLDLNCAIVSYIFSAKPIVLAVFL